MRTAFLIMVLAVPAAAQEWYIPKRQHLLKKGSLETGFRTQFSANNDGFFDSLRLEGIPNIRYSPMRRFEVYTEMPLSYAEREDSVNFTTVNRKVTGFGDLFTQLSYEGFSGADWKILFSLEGGFPTGKNQFQHPVPTGSGHYSAAFGMTGMKVVDPVVFFAHLGFQHSFSRTFPGVGRVTPGRDIRFRFGSAISLNPRVQTTFHVTSNLISTTKLNGVLQTTSSGTLMRFGWGLDWTVGSRTRLGFDTAIGLTKNTTDATIALGVTWKVF